VDRVVEFVVWYLAFLFSVTLHEASHAWAAKRGGDLTAYLGGQVSIDPVPHIGREPFGMLVLPLLSIAVFGWPFGFASTPYDPVWARRYPRRAAWMSLAGPAANLVLVVLAAIGIRIGVAVGGFEIPASAWFTQVTTASAAGAWETAALILSVLFSLNLILVVLNLIPLPPLDGSGALPLLMSEEVALRYQHFMSRPLFGWIGLLIAWNLFAEVFRPIFLLALSLLYPGTQYG
jgi:Zn-dependent protease